MTLAKSTMDKDHAYPLEKIRNDFPALRRNINGKPLVYLDNAATSLKPQAVVDSVTGYYQDYSANVHRGIHTLSEEATEAYDAAHEKVADFIQAPDWREVVFTKNCSESLNLLSVSLARSGDLKGGEVIITEMEHHSNIVPWQQLAKQYDFTLKYIPVTETGELDLEAYKGLLSDKTRVVSVTHMSNVLGTINPMKEVGRMAHEAGALFAVDGAQSVPHIPVDVQKMDADFFVFSGHKMCGPTGVGVLWGKTQLLERMEPFLYGGDMISAVFFDKEAQWNDLPWKFEAGSPVIAQGIGLGAAIDYLQGIGMDNVHAHEQRLVKKGFDVLSSIKGLTLYGPEAKKRGGVLSFWADPVHPHDLASLLDQDGIAIRAGHHCAMPLVLKLGQPALARASLYIYNTEEEIELLGSAIEKAREVFI